MIDGLSPKSFLSEFDTDDQLKIAFDTYADNLLRAYYAKDEGEVKKILKESRDLLNGSGLADYIAFVEKKVKDEKLALRY